MHEKYMKRALKIAENGLGYVNPNPLVGAVIVKNNRIIGEGYHEIFGGAHAEVNAFNNANEDVKGATMYVTLEPCSHYGKTPPCVDALVDRGISKVVVAMKDPNPIVAGKGIEKLRNNNIEVIVGVLENEAKKLNEVYIKYITTNEPFCVMKTAMTMDGKIATSIGDSKWITNELSREYVHKLRHKFSGIMVGVGTVLADNPSLTTRLKGMDGVDSTRIIIDTSCRIPISSNLMQLESKAETIIATTEKAEREKIKILENLGGKVIITPLKDNKVDLRYLIKKLGEMGIDSILLEGGSTLNYSALREGIVDKVISFIAPQIVGGKTAKTPVGGDGIKYMYDSIKLRNIEIKRFKDDIMIEGYIGKEE